MVGQHLIVESQRHDSERMHPLGKSEPAGVRLLFQRQPQRRSSALEPEARETASGFLCQSRHPAFQRLWRSGRAVVRRHGFEEILLAAMHIAQRLPERALVALKAAVFVLALVPVTRLAIAALLFPEWLGANPAEYITRSLGDWTLRLLLLTLCVTPARRLFGGDWLLRLRRMLGLFAFFRSEERRVGKEG